MFAGGGGGLGVARRSSARNSTKRHFRLAVAHAEGVPAALRFHDLRHSCVAFLHADGADVDEVRRVLGHRSIRTTIDTYGHLFEGHRDGLMERLDARAHTACAQNARWRQRDRATERRSRLHVALTRITLGADDGIRTRDPHLGKVMLYQLSHVRVSR